METEEKLLAKVKKIANKNGYVSIGEINKKACQLNKQC